MGIGKIECLNTGNWIRAGHSALKTEVNGIGGASRFRTF